MAKQGVIRRIKWLSRILGPRGAMHLMSPAFYSGPALVGVPANEEHGALHLRLGASDPDVYRQVFKLKQYDLGIEPAPRTIIDAGANVGYSAVFFARRYPNARIIAIELDPANFELLLANAASLPNVECLNAALWWEMGSVRVHDDGSGAWGRQVHDARLHGEAHSEDAEVEAITMGAVLDRFSLDHVDFLKLDIEGAEREVLEHSSGWIDRVGVIAAELHDWIKPGCSRAFFEATKGFKDDRFFGENHFCIRERSGVSFRD